MSKLLYITCDLRPNEESGSLLAGMAFLEKYLTWNPDHQVDMLDLYRDSIPPADADVLSALEKTGRGHHFATLTTIEQRKMSRIKALAGQFAAAEKYVLVAPMWKPGFPPQMLAYLDAILMAGTTYRNTPEGPRGLLKYPARKCLLIHGIEGFPMGERELPCVTSIRDIMRFLGIDDFRSISIEAVPLRDASEAAISGEIGKVAEAAAIF